MDTSEVIDWLCATMTTCPGVDDLALAAAQRGLERRLPDDYKDLLRRSNGLEGLVADTYLKLWPAEKLVAANDGYGVRELLPELTLTLIGSNGAGEAYGLVHDHDRITYVGVPFMFELELVTPLGDDLAEFIARIRRSPPPWTLP